MGDGEAMKVSFSVGKVIPLAGTRGWDEEGQAGMSRLLCGGRAAKALSFFLFPRATVPL